jgi:hypothetical protein
MWAASKMPMQATSRSAKLGLIPGWNESAEDLRVLANGRKGKAPNWGLVTDNVALLLNAMHLSRSVIADIDIESPFMAWLNDTPGHWEPIPGSDQKRWVLDRPPTIGPAGIPSSGRWSCDDRVWPLVVQRASAFLRGLPCIGTSAMQR